MGLAETLLSPLTSRRSANQRCMECAGDCLFSETFDDSTNAFRQFEFQSND